MPHNGPRMPHHQPSSTNNNTDNAYFIDFGYDNYRSNQPYIEDQDTSFFVGDLENAFYDAFPPVDQDFVIHDPLSFPTIALPVSAGVPYQRVPGASGYYFPPGIFERSVGQFPYNPGNTAPIYSLSPPCLRPGKTPPTATAPAPWPAPLAPTNSISLPTVFTSLENNRPSLYRCLECPNTPDFGSHKDLKRHYITNKAHWSEETRFYRCCCAAYDRPRKDHHLRHIQSCNEMPRTPYACICSREDWSLDEHIQHVKDCGRRRQ